MVPASSLVNTRTFEVKNMVSHVLHVTVRTVHEIPRELSRIGAINRILGHRRISKENAGLFPIEICQYDNEFRIHCLTDADTLRVVAGLPESHKFGVFDLSSGNSFRERTTFRNAVAIPSSRGGRFYTNRPPKPRFQNSCNHSLRLQLAGSILNSAIIALQLNPCCVNPFKDWQQEFERAVDIFDGEGRNCQKLKTAIKERVNLWSVNCVGVWRPPLPPFPPPPHACKAPSMQNAAATYDDSDSDSSIESSSSSSSIFELNANDIEKLHSTSLSTDFTRGPLPKDSHRHSPSLLQPPAKIEIMKWVFTFSVSAPIFSASF